MKHSPLAALIAGVPRLAIETGVEYDQVIVCNDGPFVRYDAVLAALEAAPAPDLVEAGKVLEGVTPGPWMREAQGVYHSNGHGLVAHLKPHEWGRDWPTLERDGDFIAWCREGVPALIALCQAQAAQIAGLDAELSSGSFYKEADIDALMNRAEAAEADAATLRAEVERLRGVVEVVSASFHQLARERDLTEIELDFMRRVDDALEGKADG